MHQKSECRLEIFQKSSKEYEKKIRLEKNKKEQQENNQQPTTKKTIIK